MWNLAELLNSNAACRFTCEPPRDDGRHAPRGTLRPAIGRRAQANGARAPERAGLRQKECGDIHLVGKRGLSSERETAYCFFDLTWAVLDALASGREEAAVSEETKKDKPEEKRYRSEQAPPPRS